MTSATAAHPYHHGDLREALVSAAMAQLRAEGAESVSLRAIAAQVGVSPSAAYHHFPNKTALLLAVGDRGAAEFGRQMRAATESVRGSSDSAAIRRFEALGRAYVEFALDEPHLFRHVFGPVRAAVSEADLKLDRDAAGDSAFAVLVDALDELQRRGLVRSGARESLELIAWTTVHGFATLVTDGWLPRQATDQLLDAIRRTIVEPPRRAGQRRNA